MTEKDLKKEIKDLFTTGMSLCEDVGEYVDRPTKTVEYRFDKKRIANTNIEVALQDICIELTGKSVNQILEGITWANPDHVVGAKIEATVLTDTNEFSDGEFVLIVFTDRDNSDNVPQEIINHFNVIKELVLEAPLKSMEEALEEENEGEHE